ncbi:tRNA threonylcarbamoyladenosine dehydratase [Keratinibaculum paraultunense]|uniref:tRNA threonylcarbamoyladenosine dehydratase n=1 Tax=Keratinibaculum paraultunense TaxID=1278232 RepID=UPI001ED8CB9B
MRTELLLGKKAMKKLANSKVAVFGIGGVGSYTSEALVRSGLGNIVLVDYDIIDVSNINRQIHATSKTVGQLKVNVMKDRLLEINPDLNIVVYDECYSEENAEELLSPSYNYVVDAIDMVSSKINLIEKCKALKIPIISCMGAGNKLDPTMFQVGDIYETFNCPLAKVMRKELKKRGIQDLKVVWSKENPIKINLRKSDNRKTIPGSVSFVPSVAGLIIASEVVKDLVMEV